MSKATAETWSRPGRWTKEERRAQITAIALQMIARHGVQGATLRRIARAAGISTPALYNHFSNRNEILEAAMDMLQARVFEWIDTSSNPNMYERLRELGGSVHESAIMTDREWVILPLFELVAAAPAEHLTQEMGRRQLAVLQRFIDIVEEGKRQGTIRQDADAKVVGWSLMGLGWTKDFAVLEGLECFITDGTAAKILDNILAGIAAEPARETPVDSSGH